jgi:hypothetical protein
VAKGPEETTPTVTSNVPALVSFSFLASRTLPTLTHSPVYSNRVRCADNLENIVEEPCKHKMHMNTLFRLSLPFSLSLSLTLTPFHYLSSLTISLSLVSQSYSSALTHTFLLQVRDADIAGDDPLAEELTYTYRH